MNTTTLQAPSVDLKALCSEKLKELRSNVTPKDKRLAHQRLNISRQTIEAYLLGRVTKIDLAMELIEFFVPIISERVTKLKVA